MTAGHVSRKIRGKAGNGRVWMRTSGCGRGRSGVGKDSRVWVSTAVNSRHKVSGDSQ